MTPSRRRGLAFVMLLAGSLPGFEISAAQEPTRQAVVEPPDAARATVPLRDIAPWSPPQVGQVGLDAPNQRVQTYLEAARRRSSDGDHLGALSELDAALLLPDAPPCALLQMLAETLLQLGRIGEARQAAEHALLRRPHSVETHLLLGRLLRRQGIPDAARSHLRAATAGPDIEQDDPKVTLAWFELGDCLAEQGYLLAAAQAFAAFDAAIGSTYPHHRDHEPIAALLRASPRGMLDRRIELLRSVGREQEAIDAIAEARSRHPDDPALERLHVQSLLDAGRPDDAFAFCLQRLRDTPGTASADRDRVISLLVTAGASSSAMSDWLLTLQQDVLRGQSAQLAEQVARQLEGTGCFDAAAGLWEALGRAAPQRADFTWHLAAARRRAGDLTGAVDVLADLVRSRSLTEKGTEVDVDRFRAWMSEPVPPGDVVRLVQERDTPPADFADDLVLAMTAAAGGQVELAERLFERARAAQPDCVLAHLARGQAMLSAYRWDEALREANAALALNPASAAAHIILADAHAGLDAFDEAQRALRSAVEQAPRSVAVNVALARNYRQTGDLLAAQRYLQQAWAVDRAHDELVEELVDTYLEAGKFDIACTRVEEAAASNISADVLRRLRTVLRFAQSPFEQPHREELARQLAEHPDDWRTGLRLATAHFLHEDPGAALDVLNALDAADFGSSVLADDYRERAAYLRARVFRRLLNYDEAARLLEQWAARYPRRAPVLEQLAATYLADFRLDEARDAFVRLTELAAAPPRRDRARAMLLGTFAQFGEYDQAIALLDGWLSQEPDALSWQRARVDVLLLADRRQEAVQQVREHFDAAKAAFDDLAARVNEVRAALRAQPNDPELQARFRAFEPDLNAVTTRLLEWQPHLVQVCMQAEQYDVALACLEQWLEAQPGNLSLSEWLVQVLLAAGRPDDAWEAIGKVTPQGPADIVSIRVWRAKCRAAQGQLDEARADLLDLLDEGYVRENPGLARSLRQELLLLCLDPRYAGPGNTEAIDEAVRLCENWLAEVSESDTTARVAALMLKRLALSSTDLVDEQIATMEAMLAVQPHDPGLNNDLAYTWVTRGEQLERSLEMLTLAVHAEPLNAAFLDSLGWAHYVRGDFDAARRYLSRAVRLRAGRDAVVCDHLGDAEYRLGDREAAARAWREALEHAEKAAQNAMRRSDLERPAMLRAKLAALTDGQRVPIAPTAAEQRGEP